MKKLIVLAIPFLVMFCCSAANAQAGAINANAQPMQTPDHVLHAEPRGMAIERPIVGQGSNTYTSEHGERPLWEFPSDERPTPLGDVARAYRQQKLAAKKATMVFEKEGS